MPFIFNVVAGKKKASGGGGQDVLEYKTIAGTPSTDATMYYINTSGRAWAWGSNIYFTIGDNSSTNRCTPVSVLGATKTFCHIDAGSNHSVAIDKNGKAWAWGTNNTGQLGTFSTTNFLTPRSVYGNKTFCQIAAGGNNTVAIDYNGQAWSWGQGNVGQLGNGNISNFCYPVSVAGSVKTFCKISVGFQNSVAIDKNGQVWGWGVNGNGQLGDNSTLSKRTPVSILGATKTFCKIDSGTFNTVAIDKNGRAWSWGWNSKGQLGDNSLTQRCTPVSVAGVTKTFCHISAGNEYSIAIDKNGKAWGWGDNIDGQLGDNTKTSRLTPVSVYGNKTFCKIASGGRTSIAIDNYGYIWTWGKNSKGELGNSYQSAPKTPKKIENKTFCQIASGPTFYFLGGITNTGTALGWGRNNRGQVGDNTIVDKSEPTSVAGSTKTFCHISVGWETTVAIDKNGQAWGWGSNTSYAIGNGGAGQSKRTPFSVGGATKTFCKISAGSYYTLALDKNGTLWSWGFQTYGELGNIANYIQAAQTPKSIIGTAKTFCEIATGEYHSAAIDQYGTVWTWGNNQRGQLGNNTIFSYYSPVIIAGAKKIFCKISAGSESTTAIDSSGQVWSWGNNTSGQLGDGVPFSKRTPVSVGGVRKTFCEISLSGIHVLALDKNGKLWSWGNNQNGQLGDNTTTARCTPVSVAGATKTFCKIGTSYYNSYAIDKNGEAWAWGWNTYGQLADGLGVQLTPVRVCNI